MDHLLGVVIDPDSNAVIKEQLSAPEWERIAEALQKRKFVAVHIDDGAVQDKATLLHALASALNFPSYFGENWDALVDVLWDLSWYNAPGYVMYLSDPERLPADVLETFVEIVEEASTERWAPAGIPFKLLLSDDHTHSSHPGV